jgi:signal transduction histidine kinase
VDKLNSLSYAYHYRNLDSTEHYARLAFSLSVSPSSSTSPSGVGWVGIHADRRSSIIYPDGAAEALNNLAFVSIARMRYEEAARRLDSIPLLTDNQLELLVASVQQMRLCQRRSANREFYDYRERATRSLSRINEERSAFSERQLARLCYAESEMAIVTSAYYYYVGLLEQSADALQTIPDAIQQDTAQWMNYLYNVGAGGIITHLPQEDINQQEFDHLMRCNLLAQQTDCPYFLANSLESLAEHLLSPAARNQLLENNLYALKFINTADVTDDQLPSQLAEEALCLFQQYGDVYQTAGAFRTLASCSRAKGNNGEALYYLEHALADSAILQAPDLVASIREQLSVAYAAVDNKTMSDINRNVYLDLQEQTRQDRSLEARADQLDAAVAQLNKLLIAIVAAILLMVLQIIFFSYRRRHRHKQEQNDDLETLLEGINERLAIARLHIQDGERRHLEQRAKVSLANGITPFIDRMLYEVTHNEAADRQYLNELIDEINEQNELLTQWIQLRQGELSLHIESFPLQPLFDIVAKGRNNFQSKGVQLTIAATPAVVKADRVLTLFMLNTLADNARKFTERGGKVAISASEQADYVEISVSDTGCGMTNEQLDQVFDRKVICNDKMQTSHGFGLLNCKGIIEKYRKTSRLFAVSTIGATSEQGRGSRFFFRLPRGVVHTLIMLLFGWGTLAAQNIHLGKASAYADSAYFSNIRGTYERTLLFADSCRQELNAFYLAAHPQSADTLMALDDLSLMPADVLWLHDSIRLNYDILLILRNESAVASLALHEWDLYAYNNRIYTQLFKELSADNQLADYCRKMQQSQSNRTTAIVLLALILLSVLMAVAWQMMVSIRHSVQRRQEQQYSLNLMEDELRKKEMEEARLHVSNQVLDNCLSALKHETMYYPSRIRQLADMGDNADLPDVVSYYRVLYGILSEQAMSQVKGISLHLKPLQHEVLGDENLINYMFDLLRKQSGSKAPLAIEYQKKDDRHIECRVELPGLRLTDEEARQLFTPGEGHIPFLLCRQIVRDHGEATGRRGCGIRAEVNDGKTIIDIILPRMICKNSKYSS